MSDTATSVSPRKQRAAKILFWVAMFLMIVMPAGLYLEELRSAFEQARINRTSTRIEATVVSSRIHRIEESKGGVRFRPEITFKYEVDGKVYQSDRLYALGGSGDEEWAESITNRFRPGEPCHAYREPEHPERAILLRGYAFSPYFGMLEMAFVLSVASWMLRRMRREMIQEPKRSEDGWFEVPPKFGERDRLLAAKISSAVWYGLGAIPAIHYFSVVSAPHPVPVRVFIGYGLLGLIPVYRLIRYFLVDKNVDDARLLINQAAACPGGSFRFTLTQAAHRQLELRKVTVRFRCIGTKVRGNSRERRTLHEAIPVELKEHILHLGEQLTLSGELNLPANARPTGRDSTREFSYINWELRLDCEIPKAPDYTVTFPIDVIAAPAVEPEVSVRKTETFAEVRAVEPAGGILSRPHIWLANGIGLLPMAVMLFAVVAMFSVYPLVFPEDKTKPFLDVPVPEAKIIFTAAAVTAGLAVLYGILSPSFLASLYVYRLTRRVIDRRVDAVVRPGPDSVWVDVIPRRNWNRLMLENASDIGFLTIDQQRREIRFEGDKERYRIPGAAIYSCRIEKSYYTDAAAANAPGIAILVIRAYRKDGLWEVPITARLMNPRVFSKQRQRIAEQLSARIEAIMPAPQSEAASILPNAEKLKS